MPSPPTCPRCGSTVPALRYSFRVAASEWRPCTNAFHDRKPLGTPIPKENGDR